MKKLVSILFTVCGISAQNLITNGDFETDAVSAGAFSRITTTNGLTGWWVGADNSSTPALVDVDLCGEGVLAAPSGNATQFVDLNGLERGRIRQDFTTTGAATYTVTFKYAKNRNGGIGADAWCRVFETGTPGIAIASRFLTLPVMSTSGTTDTNQVSTVVSANVWTEATFGFTATGTATSIAFEANNAPPEKASGGILIDDVSIEED